MAYLEEILGRSAWLLFDLELIGGRCFYFTDSPDPQTITDAAGNVKTYAPGLKTLSLVQTAGKGMSNTGLQIAGTASVDWAEVVSRGAVLQRAKGVLRRWYEGQEFGRSTVWLRGVLTDPSYGAKGEPLNFGLERLRSEGGMIPRASMIITEATWPVDASYFVDEAVVGLCYPMIFGQPTQASTPGYLVEYLGVLPGSCKLLIAGHAVEATTVTLHDVAGGVSATRTVLQTLDKLGVLVSYVNFSGLTWAPEKNREYRIAWDQGKGGMIDQGLTAMWGAGDIAGHLLRKWSDIDVDWGEMSGNIDTINSFKLGFAIVEPTEVWDWIRSELLPILPAEWVETDLGGYIQPWNLDADKTQRRGHLDMTPGGDVERDGRVKYGGGRIVNEISVQYSFGGEQFRPLKTVVLTAGADEGGKATIVDKNVRPNAWCRVSQSFFGLRQASPVQTTIVYDSATANLIAKHLALRHAIPRRAVQVSGPLVLDRFRVSEVLTLQADDLYWIAQPVQVRAKKIIGDKVTLTLLLLEPYGAATERRIV
jgi:hypothetical protein